ncbi:hypothetical protein FN976_27250 [Caenimonas sedimenti]|uniref:Uncharacterized protein n=1 Tax=Caenimonas sedimenti TaxID=2596921 RepID=A0A562ZEY1_9BURK|nr:hypothetical protein [Caenimonas sedimenti]TWO65506.1 hypothetical protein FN976_27250 [Caenimonas sedimenti]
MKNRLGSLWLRGVFLGDLQDIRCILPWHRDTPTAMSDHPPLLHRLEELDASRKSPIGAFLGAGICILGLAVSFGDLRPAPGVAAWQIQVLGGFVFMFGLFWALHSLRMARASTAAFMVGAALFLVITHWAAFGPGERSCTSGRLRIPTSEAECRFWFGAFSIFMDAVLLLGAVALFARKK